MGWIEALRASEVRLPYTGVTEEQILAEGVGPNGIDHWARRGIAGRGILIDFPLFAATQGTM
jgi:hypothetical protein